MEVGGPLWLARAKRVQSISATPEDWGVLIDVAEEFSARMTGDMVPEIWDGRA